MWINETSVLLALTFMLIAGCDLSFAQSKREIYSVDFRNFTYDLYNNGEVTLKNGDYKIIHLPGSGLISTRKLTMLKYTDFDGDGKKEAIVAIRSTDTGSMPVSMDYFIYKYDHSKPQQIFHEWREGREGICVQNRSIILIGVAWEKEEIPHCCPPFTETKVYRWRDSHFALVKTYRRKNYPFQNLSQLKNARQCGNIR
jgi:hypothetical protein